MKKYLFIATLLVPTTGAMAQSASISLVNNVGQVAYQLTGGGISNGYTGCLNQGSSAGITATSNGIININADVGCTGNFSNISNIQFSTNCTYTLQCNGTTCQEQPAPVCTNTSIRPTKKLAK